MKRSNHLLFQESGKGPAVVLLHDNLMTPDSWGRQIPDLLKSEFRVVVPDFSKINGDNDLGSISHSIIALLDKLGIGRAAICGLGMGGSILLSLLEHYQHRIAGACFINTRFGSDDVHEKYKRAEIISALSHGEELSARTELLKMLFGGRERHFSQAAKQEIGSSVYQYDRDALVRNLKMMQERKDFTTLLSQLKLPTQVIYAQDDLICHPGYSQLMLSRLPNCIKDSCLVGGHMIHIENAAALTAELLEFLQAIVPRRFRPRTLYSLMAA